MPSLELLLAVLGAVRALGLFELGMDGLLVEACVLDVGVFKLAREKKGGAHRLHHTETFINPVPESMHHGLLPEQRRVLGHFRKLLRCAVCLEHLRRHDGDFEVFCTRNVDAMSRERRKSRLELWPHRTCTYIHSNGIVQGVYQDVVRALRSHVCLCLVPGLP